MRKSVSALAVFAAGAIVLSAAPSAMAASVEFGKSREFILDVPEELSPMVYEFDVGPSKSKVSGKSVTVTSLDRDEWVATARAVEFGKSKVYVTWDARDDESGEVVTGDIKGDTIAISCTRASIPASKCDKIFDGVAYTASKLCSQRDSSSKSKLGKALKGYRFKKGNGYVVLNGGKSIRFTRGGKKVRVHLAKGGIKPTLTVGVVHSREAEYRYLTSNLPKTSRVVSRHYSKGECEVIIRGSYHGVSMNVIAWTWYRDGKRQHMQWLA